MALMFVSVGRPGSSKVKSVCWGGPTTTVRGAAKPVVRRQPPGKTCAPGCPLGQAAEDIGAVGRRGRRRLARAGLSVTVQVQVDDASAQPDVARAAAAVAAVVVPRRPPDRPGRRDRHRGDGEGHGGDAGVGLAVVRLEGEGVGAAVVAGGEVGERTVGAERDRAVRRAGDEGGGERVAVGVIGAGQDARGGLPWSAWCMRSRRKTRRRPRAAGSRRGVFHEQAGRRDEDRPLRAL